MRRRPSSYLLRVSTAAGVTDRLVGEIRQAIPAVESKRDHELMIALLAELARHRIDHAWETLIWLAEMGDESSQDALPEVDARGLDWLVEHVLPHLAEDDRYRTEFWVMSAESAGYESKQIAVLKAFERDLPRAPEPPTRTVREVLDEITDAKTPTFSLAFVANQATNTELVEIAERLVAAKERRLVSTYSKVFTRHAFPLDPALLMARTNDESCGFFFLQVLSKMNTEAVHDFAVEYLTTRPLLPHALMPLEASFQMGDIPLVEGAIRDSADFDNDDLHGFAIDLERLVKRMPPDEQPRFWEWIYENTPCSLCRDDPVKALLGLGCLPDRICEEGIHDANETIRELVKSPSSNENGTDTPGLRGLR